MSLTTKRALAASFEKLLAKRGLDKITVKEIVEDCGVNRQTFYYHFHDVYDLMEWVFQDTADTLLKNKDDLTSWEDGLDALMSFLRENRVLVTHAYHSVSHEALSESIKKILRPYILKTVRFQAEEMVPPPDQENVDFVTDVLTLAIRGIIIEWISSRRETEAEVRLEKFKKAINGSIQFMLHNLNAEEQ